MTEDANIVTEAAKEAELKTQGKTARKLAKM